MNVNLGDLLQKYLSSSLTEAEEQAFIRALHDEQYRPALERLIDEYGESCSLVLPADESLLAASFERLQKSILTSPAPATIRPLPNKKAGTSWFKYAAAILILVVGTLMYFRFVDDNTDRDLTRSSGEVPAGAAILPGGDKALLTLADGRKIVLDDASNGNLADQGNARIIKMADGKIIYNATGDAKEPVWNTMSTPAGGQYQVTLPDGTQAWLNSSASVTYPTAFTGKKREVKITGEVYLEVAANRQQPFMVDVNGRTVIEVLGTKFNVNAYTNEESVRTTLVEGSVRITRGSATDLAISGAALPSAILKPGQQAAVDFSNAGSQQSNKDIKVIAGADVDQALAWKNGLFNFNGLQLRSVMRQLERWYDIEVKYEASVPDIVFKGKMYRNIALSDVLQVLREMGVNFKMEGRILTITSAGK